MDALIAEPLVLGPLTAETENASVLGDVVDEGSVVCTRPVVVESLGGEPADH